MPTGNILGHLAIADKMLVPNGVHYRGVPLYIRGKVELEDDLHSGTHSALEHRSQMFKSHGRCKVYNISKKWLHGLERGHGMKVQPVLHSPSSS